MKHLKKNNLAATYSRGIYKTTTIGKTVFDGRVRNGNGSDHSFMATKNLLVSRLTVLTENVKERFSICQFTACSGQL